MNLSPNIQTILDYLSIAGIVFACDVESFDDAVARNNSGGTSPPPPPPPSAGFGSNFSEIQDNVLTPTCTSGCHSGAGPSAGLNLEEANSYAELVGISSSQDAGFQRVLPGNPDNSYLIRKPEDAAGIVGSQMPIGSPAILQSDIDQIRLWITNGADP